MHIFCAAKRKNVLNKDMPAHNGKYDDNDMFSARRGPSPLPVHLNLAMAEFVRLKESGDATDSQLEKMLQGIKKYQAYPYRRQESGAPVVYKNCEVTVYFYAAKEPRSSVFLLPSMINKSYILDLVPEKSFVRWLAEKGIDVYLLDWGSPVADEGLYDIDSVLTKRVGAAIKATADHSRNRHLHSIGYCMGGTILAAALSYSEVSFASAVFLASPWDFAAGSNELSGYVRAGAATALQKIEVEDCLPKEWIQSVFAAANAAQALKKFSDFAEMEQGSKKAEMFVAVEDWLNDGVDLPGGLARTCVVDWYCKNLTGSGQWSVAGRKIDLSEVKVPSLIIASDSDKLVSSKSSQALVHNLPYSDLLKPTSGHIGMMIGRKSEREVWQPIADWILDRA